MGRYPQTLSRQHWNHIQLQIRQNHGFDKHDHCQILGKKWNINHLFQVMLRYHQKFAFFFIFDVFWLKNRANSVPSSMKAKAGFLAGTLHPTCHPFWPGTSTPAKATPTTLIKLFIFSILSGVILKWYFWNGQEYARGSFTSSWNSHQFQKVKWGHFWPYPR